LVQTKLSMTWSRPAGRQHLAQCTEPRTDLDDDVVGCDIPGEAQGEIDILA
jgi:hypothetical protein